MTNNKFSRYINLGAGGEQRAERVQQIRRQASNFNKRGLSDIVSTSVLIILALASVGFAGYSVMNLLALGDIQSSPTYNCLDLTTRLTLPVQITKACINSEGKVEALIQRSSEELSINSLSFVLEDETWTCSQNTCGSACEVLNKGTSKIYHFTPNQNPLDKKLEVYLGTCKIDEKKIGNC